MRLKEFVLLTKDEAEKLCNKLYVKTKIVPIYIKEDNEYGQYYATYYMVYVQLVNNRWTPMIDIKPEYIK